MEKKENQRVVLTKRLLTEALIRLMDQKSIQKITVSELCREAGINRATFYNHYNTPTDLLEEMEDNLVGEIHALLSRRQTQDNSLHGHLVEQICTYLQQNSTIATLLFRNNTAVSDFAYKLFNTPYVLEDLRAQLEALHTLIPSDNSEALRSLLITGVLTGSYSMIRQWLMEGMPVSPAELGRLTDAVFFQVVPPAR